MRPRRPTASSTRTPCGTCSPSRTPGHRMLLRIGSRGSRLALPQAELAPDGPRGAAGDRDRSKPFGEIGARGVFVKEIEEALLAERVDVAVHSAKDMTSTDTEGLVVGAFLPREDARDALCGVSELRAGMRIGTASIRRRAQLLGLGLADQIDRRFEPDVLLPEAGQGALALQIRAGEESSVALADDAETRRRVEAERACVGAIGGGCLAPVAAHHDGSALTALVAAEDGSWVERRSGTDAAAVAADLLAFL